MADPALDVQRFRPNLVIDAASDAPFPEDEWVGRVLRIGAMHMRVDERDQRCVIVDVDPATGFTTAPPRSPGVFGVTNAVAIEEA